MEFSLTFFVCIFLVANTNKEKLQIQTIEYFRIFQNILYTFEIFQKFCRRNSKNIKIKKPSLSIELIQKRK